MKIKCQCFICKKEILEGELKEHELDPCSILISSNIDKNYDERREQTFFCHFECFRQINNDDSTIYLEELATIRQYNEEILTIKEIMENFANMLQKEAKDLDI